MNRIFIRIEVFLFTVTFIFLINAEELLVDSRAIYPNSYAFIIQTEKDSASLRNPVYAINTNLYSGIKKGLWINVAGFGSTIKEVEKYKSKYPDGYIKKLGQYRFTKSVDRDSVPEIKTDWVVETGGFFIYDSQFVEKNELIHIIKVRNSNNRHLTSDTFTISTESEVGQIHTCLFHSHKVPLVVERSYSSEMTGSSFEIRIFSQIGERYCMEESFTNDGGPEDPISSLHFDKTDQPVLEEVLKDSVLSQTPLSCNKRN